MALGIDPAAKVLKINRGATFTDTITLKQNGTPVNLTGATAALTMRPRYSRKVLAALTDVSGLTLGGVLGTIVIVIDLAATTLFVPNDFPADYSMRIVFPDTTADMILDGIAELRAGSIV